MYIQYGQTKIYWFKRRIWSLRKWLNYRQRSNGYDNVLTLVERQTRMGFAVKIKSKSAFLVISKLKKISDHNLIVKSITIDNGIEFERWVY
nr:hypothetical protein [Mycoplasmopsis bovis]